MGDEKMKPAAIFLSILIPLSIKIITLLPSQVGIIDTRFFYLIPIILVGVIAYLVYD